MSDTLVKEDYMKNMYDAVRILFERNNSSKWFCVVDVCKILGYKDSSTVLKANCIGKPIKHRPEGSTTDILYINEANLYSLIIRSTKPNAIPFRKQIVEEILPELLSRRKYSIRKFDLTGLDPIQPEGHETNIL